MTPIKRIGSAVLATAIAASAAVSSVPVFAQDEPGSNLVLRYDFGSLKNGTIVQDLSGNGNTGTLMPDGAKVETDVAPLYGSEQTAFALKGGQPGASSPCIALPPGVLNGLEDVTISCWVNLSRADSYNRIWDIGSGTTSYMYLLDGGYNSGHTGYTAALTNSGWSNEKGPEKGSALPHNEWVRTTVTFDGSAKEMKLYENNTQIGGTVKTDVDLSVLKNVTKNYIGFGQFGNDLPTGLIADFRIYDSALTADQIAELTELAPADRISRDVQALELGDLSAIETNLALPATGEWGSAVSWASSDESVVKSDGTVTRPSAGSPDAEVTLTATISSGSAQAQTKQFAAVVKALPSNEYVVENDLAAINLGNLENLTSNLTLPTAGGLGSTISWSSSNPGIIAPDGTVVRPVADAPVKVILTATAACGGVTATRTFDATVKNAYETLDIVRIEPISVTTSKGVSPSLPATVKATFEDETTQNAKVTWPVQIDASLYAQAGSFTVEGSVVGYDGVKATANVTVTEEPIPAPAAAASAFSLNDVSLDGDDTVFTQNAQINLDYLKTVDVNKMLYNFYVNYGQTPPSDAKTGGWDGPTARLRGHYTGHFMSALALAYASTGEQVYKDRLDSMVTTLQGFQQMAKGNPQDFQTKCSILTDENAWKADYEKNSSKNPAEWGEGYLGAYSPDQVVILEQMHWGSNPPSWAPYYTMHKLMAGLLDSYNYTGNQQALEVAKGMGLWCYNRLKNVDKQRLSEMFSYWCSGEMGGIGQTMVQLYQITGDQRFSDGAAFFDNTSFLDGLASNQDVVAGKHANQHIPEALSAVYEYQATGNAYYYNAAKNFWDIATARYSYSTGGAGSYESYPNTPYQQAHNIVWSGENASGNCETCATYNMLKLSMQLAAYDPDNAKYMDWYERTLVNQMASSNGRNEDYKKNGYLPVTYMLPLSPGEKRSYNAYGGYSCCHGSGMESHVKYQEAAYTKSADALYVNLYLPTTLEWAEKDLTVQQETAFPSEDSTLTFTGSGSTNVKLRVPYWATNGFTVKHNGKTVCTNPEASSYVEIEGVKSGDTLTVHMPYTLHLDRTPDKLNGKTVASVMYGPLVMVAKSNSYQWQTLSLSGKLADTIEVGSYNTGDDGNRTSPKLTTNGLEFIPLFDAVNCQYHAYVQVDDTTSVVNTDTLQEMVDNCSGKNASDYTADSWKKFDDALKNAQSILGNPDATQVDVYNAQTALSDALNGLVNSTKVNKDTLNLFIAKAQSFVDDGTVNGLVASAKKVYLATLAKAKEVAGNENATYAEVVDIQTKLLVCIHSVSQQAGDKQVLGMLLASCDNLTDEMLSANYVEAGQAEYKAALAAAKAVYADGDAFQGDVDKAHSDLSAAVLALRMKADKSALQALLNQVGGINLSLYTEASAAVFTAALANVNSVLANEALSVDDQATVDEAVKTLQAAVDGLELKSVSTDDTSSAGSNNSGSSSKPDSGKPSGTTSKPSAQTGDTAPIAAAALLLATAAGAMAFIKRQKK